MKTLFIVILSFTFGILIAGIRMTDDKKTDEVLKIKRVSDGVVLFVPKDDDFPYKVGDLFEDRKNTELGLVIVEYVVIDDFKIK